MTGLRPSSTIGSDSVSGRRPRGAVTALRDALRHLALRRRRAVGGARFAEPSRSRGRSAVSITSFPTWRPTSTASTSRRRRGRNWRPRPAASDAGAAVLAADLSVALATLARRRACGRWRSRASRWRLRPTVTSRCAGPGISTCWLPRATSRRAHRALSDAGWRPAAGYPAAWAVLGLASLRPDRQRAHPDCRPQRHRPPLAPGADARHVP